jgi:hypothetical protein
MMVATRFGSSEAAFAQRRMSLPQYCTSRVKMGDIPELAKYGVIEVTSADLADASTGTLMAKIVSRHTIKTPARGGRI